MEEKKRSAGAVLAALGKALCYLLLFLLCQALAAVVFLLAAILWLSLTGLPGADLPSLLARASALTLAQTGLIALVSDLAVLVVLTVFFLCRKKNPLREVGLVRTDPRCVGAACAAAPLLYALVTLVLALLPEAWLNSYAEAAAALDQNDLWTVLATVILAPVTEEVIFRGLIFSRLERAMPGWLAAVLSALAFGVCHGQPVWMAYAFLLGLVFAWFRLRTGSILPSLLAHLVFNGISPLSGALSKAGAGDGWILLGLAAVGIIACFLFRRGFAAMGRRTRSAGGSGLP